MIDIHKLDTANAHHQDEVLSHCAHWTRFTSCCGRSASWASSLWPGEW